MADNTGKTWMSIGETDTTFDADGGGLTCLWMDQNYNWSNTAFKNRCGESLNLAVNLLADVLHTFYIQEVIPEYKLNIILPLLMLITTIVVLCKKRSTRFLCAF
ncbi:MAG: hypothetical protein QW468_04790 [Candidatus Bathyarchaeia archaeon]